jgi:hypothetical protein
VGGERGEREREDVASLRKKGGRNVANSNSSWTKFMTKFGFKNNCTAGWCWYPIVKAISLPYDSDIYFHCRCLGKTCTDS